MTGDLFMTENTAITSMWGPVTKPDKIYIRTFDPLINVFYWGFRRIFGSVSGLAMCQDGALIFDNSLKTS